jgi:D-galactarolactone cycloisomerase
MRIVKTEVVRLKRPTLLPAPWRPAWLEPDLQPVTSFDCAFYRLTTDDGVIGVGPFTGAPVELVAGVDPCHIEKFWNEHMSGKRFRTSGKGAAGLEIALWDIVGKAAGLPIHRLLGAYRTKIPAYAATTRLLSADQHIAQALELRKHGFRAVKFRMHRATADEDLAVMEAIHAAVGDRVRLMVDANQNAPSSAYAHWDRTTARRVARRLEALNFVFLEEPLPHTDIDGLAQIANSYDISIAGGEGIPNVYEFAAHLKEGAYDIIQPDVILGGNYGITGLRKLATVAEHHGLQIMPHVSHGAMFGISLAATLQAMATVSNCPMVEFVCDPPLLTAETQQAILMTPLCVDDDGCIEVPDGPGLGITLNEDWIKEKNHR